MSEVLTFQYALNPNKTQENALRQHVGAVRFAYNWAVNEVLSNWSQVKEGFADEYIKTSAYDLRRSLNENKGEVAPWWSEVSKEAFATGTANAAIAFKNYYARRGGVPKFHKRSEARSPSIVFSTGARRISKTHVTLPRMGEIRLHERPRKLLWLISQGATTGNYSVRFIRGRWFVTINVRAEDGLARQFHLARTRSHRHPIVGLDLGVKSLLVSSDGFVVENPRAYEKSLAKLRRLQKRLARQQKGSTRRARTREAIARQSARVHHIERDIAHKATKLMTDSYDAIVIEDLNVAGMLKNRRLSRRIQHSLFGEIRRQLEYKTQRYGNTLIIADRYYPSSKTCSHCGNVKTTLTLNERDYNCDKCGLYLDRDINAAINLENYVARSYQETINGRGGEGSGSHASVSETIPDETSSANHGVTLEQGHLLVITTN